MPSLQLTRWWIGPEIRLAAVLPHLAAPDTAGIAADLQTVLSRRCASVRAGARARGGGHDYGKRLVSSDQAIRAANTDTAIGGCPKGSGADTIRLPVGSTQTLTTVNNTTYGPTGLPVIISAITIEGNDSTIKRGSMRRTSGSSQ